MPLLVMGSDQIEALRDLRRYAEKHPYTMDGMLDRINGGIPPGDLDEFVRILPIGYKVVFTIEPNTENVLCRILTVDVDGKTPGPDACQMIMDELGFNNKVNSGKCLVQMEGAAIKIAELYK